MFNALHQVWSKLTTKTEGQTTENNSLIKRLNGRHHRQFVIIGMGRFGSSVAETLVQFDHDVLAIDSDEVLSVRPPDSALKVGMCWPLSAELKTPKIYLPDRFYRTTSVTRLPNYQLPAPGIVLQ
jgi:voltage-gated potassium channel Kch